tara:strand:- start:134 stop:466 length:333 start_codon:yes stop_codon:yes gene_type:complete
MLSIASSVLAPKIINHLRGGSDTDMVKNARDKLRANIDLSRTDLKRHNILFNNTLNNQRLKAVKPVISLRGGDIRNLVQEGRKKAQFNKALSVFTTHSNPVNNKVSHAFG